MTEDDEELWGPMPTDAEVHRVETINRARLAAQKTVYDLLGPGLTDEGKNAWLMTRSPFLHGRVPNEVLFESMDEVFDAIEQYQQGDFT